MRILCEVCKLEGYLQQLGNYYRVRHYECKSEHGKGRFFYHHQSKDWVQKQSENTKDSSENKSNINAAVGQVGVQVGVHQGVQTINPDNLKLRLEYPLSESGRRLVWFRTQAFQACDPGFKSRRPHHTFNRFSELTPENSANTFYMEK